jgi:hypothetical protein
MAEAKNSIKSSSKIARDDNKAYVLCSALHRSSFPFALLTL